jgi:hypothetical protein
MENIIIILVSYSFNLRVEEFFFFYIYISSRALTIAIREIKVQWMEITFLPAKPGRHIYKTRNFLGSTRRC